jgi:hypothetical protein
VCVALHIPTAVVTGDGFPSSGVRSVVQNLRLRREIHPINLFFPPFNEFRHLVPFPILGRF